MGDILETIDGAVIQHGHESSRAYLMQIGPGDCSKLPERLIQLAETHRYTKIFAKVPDVSAQSFFNAGYAAEAWIPKGPDKILFLAYYLDEQRKIVSHQEDITKILNMCRNRNADSPPELPEELCCTLCEEQDTDEMAAVYSQVFPSYPFPIHDPSYLQETMKTHVLYFCIKHNGKIIALSSAETDPGAAVAEMTDFAALPDWRGKSLSRILLAYMEKEAAERGIKTAYTIARAVSPGMNITFAASGYTYTGILRNNTQISGSIESMNVWYKVLSAS